MTHPTLASIRLIPVLALMASAPLAIAAQPTAPEPTVPEQIVPEPAVPEPAMPEPSIPEPIPTDPAAARGVDSRTFDPDRWQISLTPYVWIPAIDTTFTVNDIAVEGDYSSQVSDFFDKLDFALLAAAEVRKGRVGLVTDLQYVHLSDDFDADLASGAALDTDLDLTIGTASAALAYRFVQQPTLTLDGTVGARLLYMKAEVDVDVSTGASLEDEDSFTVVDPIIGARGRWRFADRWSLSGYGDIGGFGVGTEFTWQALGSVDFQISRNFELRVGYRAFAVDVEKNRFEFDLLLHGPVVGLVIRF